MGGEVFEGFFFPWRAVGRGGEGGFYLGAGALLLLFRLRGEIEWLLDFEFEGAGF